ncbi:uncharacterized protein STEHIDRAFT_120411, partial [Stereum hirsutum FP-91666 SS1]|uniref:uncharacterized protein n=1 Tax=Stereum hirsutum (strain FP-91666) TaxID=721885 RepID=UPI000440AD18
MVGARRTASSRSRRDQTPGAKKNGAFSLLIRSQWRERSVESCLRVNPHPHPPRPSSSPSSSKTPDT